MLKKIRKSSKQLGVILSQVKSKSRDSCENRNEQNENFIAFAASRNSNFDLVNDIKSIDEFECEFDSLHDAYEVLSEESLIGKERKILNGFQKLPPKLSIG